MANWQRLQIQEQWLDANGDPASGYVFKAYEAGTSTPASVAITSSGGSPQATVTLNAEGKYEVSGNEVILYIDRNYKYAIYPDSASAAADTGAFAGPYDNINYNDVGNEANVGLVGGVAGFKFDTVADMVSGTTTAGTAIDHALGQSYTTLGRATINDGGGESYIVTNDTANGYDKIDLGGSLTATSSNSLELRDTSLGALSDRSTDDTSAVNSLVSADPQIRKVIHRKTRHNSDVWGKTLISDSKTVSGKAMRYSIASLPRLMRKMATFNTETSTPIKIMSMGSSVGVGADTDAPSTDAPGAKFTEFLSEKFDKLGIFGFNHVNECVNGSTISSGSTDVATYLSSNNPDVVLLVYGMNDGAPAQFNSGQTFTSVRNNMLAIIKACREADCDVVIATTPHPNDAIHTPSFPDSIPMTYPTRSFQSTQDFTYSATGNTITASTSGTFTNTSLGFGMTVGKTITVGGTSSNNGTYTVASIDASGDFITTTELITTEAAVNSTIQRTAIDAETELIPPISDEIVSMDALGLGPGNEINVFHRYIRVNQSMREVAVETGCAVIDVEHYWFEAVYRSTVSNLYTGAEFVHPNQTGHRQSYWYALYEFAEAIWESYGQGIQQNTIFPQMLINKDSSTAQAVIRHNTTSDPLRIEADDGDRIFGVDNSGNVYVEDSAILYAGATVHQIEPLQSTDNVRYCAGMLNIGSAQNIATTTDSAGTLKINAVQSGIGRQSIVINFLNNGGTAAIATIDDLRTGGAVVNISVLTSNIVVTPVASNTNVTYSLESNYV